MDGRRLNLDKERTYNEKKKKSMDFVKAKLPKLCGAVLGTALIAFADKAVFADEVTETTSTSTVEVATTGNPATNLPGSSGVK